MMSVRLVAVDDLLPSLEQTFRMILDERDRKSRVSTKPDVQPLIPEKAAAEMLGVPRHVLRDSRKRGEIDFIRVGRRVNYELSHITEFKSKNENREIPKGR